MKGQSLLDRYIKKKGVEGSRTGDGGVHGCLREQGNTGRDRERDGNGHLVHSGKKTEVNNRNFNTPSKLANPPPPSLLQPLSERSKSPRITVLPPNH